MWSSKARVWSSAALAAVVLLGLSAESFGQGGGRGGRKPGLRNGAGQQPEPGMGQMGAGMMGGGQGMGAGPGMMGGMQGMGEGAMMARRQLMMNMPLDPSDPAVVLAVGDQLGLTPQQVAALQKIIFAARQQCAATLKPEQKQKLQAAFGGAELGKPDQQPGQFEGKQKKGMQKGAGMRGKPQGGEDNAF